MIIKSSQRAGHRQLAAHLIKSRDEDGEAQTVRITDHRHLMSAQSVHAALTDMEMMSWASPRTKKDLYHISMSPSEELTSEKWRRAWEIYETEFGLENHPFIEVTHDKKGRVHQHRVYERVDTETERSIKLSFTKIRNELVARQLEYEFGHALTVGKHNRTVMLKLAEQGKEDIVAWLEQGKAHDADCPVADVDFFELQQERRTKIKKADVKAALQEAYAKTDTGAGFEAAIAEQNLLFCRGDRRDYVVVDAQGGTHSPRRMIGVKVAELRERWSDLDPQTLLTVQEAKVSREAQWLADQEAQKTAQKEAEIIAARNEMTAAERLQEQQLMTDIAALQTQLYGELQQEALGAKLFAATYQLSTTNIAALEVDKNGVSYQDFLQWQQEHQVEDGNANQHGQGHPDQRQLIEQLQHWQTIAADQDSMLPQDGSFHGHGTGSTNFNEMPSSQFNAQENEDVAEISSWGLSPSTLLLIQTYTGQQARAEYQRRIEEALVDPVRSPMPVGTDDVTSTFGGENFVSTTPDAAAAAEREQGATRAYLQALGQQLREKGKGAYSQADRWLAEQLAKRGYTRQETRRVIAHSSPELMEQAPGARVGYVRRIVERVYRRREHWQERLKKSVEKKESAAPNTKAKSSVSRDVKAGDATLKPIPRKFMGNHPLPKPKTEKSPLVKTKENTKRRQTERDRS